MTKDGLTLIVLVVLSVCLLSLVLMKSLLWAVGFPLAFAALGVVCYGAEALIMKNKNNQRQA
ncbi:hypothetical protein [Levilactobacillus spicheri]|uniref:Uncharacterized protein n=2 Tax=Levilactobacillus spicheri TaxID=216463 RepID=A0A0F3RTN6_9LACO|nr:hypothetical protein [Levilactobacillus spicheri]KJW13336.1 hypothetical protein VC81_02395 [Levilactobacillus spicheri]KRL49216.1 hypothetical protein FD37_GL000812 [Levilactobacillus spicheri DSM 15429]GEO65642.1 hypothetical protein LSP04_00610 [Levilactobacillus spicheri]